MISIFVLLGWILLVLMLWGPNVMNRDNIKCQRQFTCGKFIRNSIGYPFGVKGDPQECFGMYLFSCEHNHTLLYLSSSSNSNSIKYYVVEDDGVASSNSIRVLDPGVEKNNCSSFPLYSFPGRNYWIDTNNDEDLMIFVGCRRAVYSPKYIATYPCLTGNEFSNQTQGIVHHSYVVFGKATEILASDIEETCTVRRSLQSRFPSLDLSNRKGNISFQDIHDALAVGYELDWSTQIFIFTYARSLLWGTTVGNIIGNVLIISAYIFGARAIIGSIFFLAFLIYKCRRRHLSIYGAIEDFLQTRNDVVPIRYSYRQIKKMTNHFKEKLGEGGYGCVYKGKLQSGQLVAVKMLSTKSKPNGRDFINEVATLGRIRHVNVVRLVGFCATTSKNALIYEYLSNGSLDKFIFRESPNNTKLNWNNIYEIAMGVALGMEYLHRGCHMQIVHFDIKPHNILLDEKLIPRISDFGLAKLRPREKNVVTMTVARGTLGYMAPELFYKTVGEISHKVDVYSFGMLLMKMAGSQRNLKIDEEHSSQVYFPSWIHGQFERGQDVEFGIHFSDEEEKEKEVARKLILIGLWCIQMRPSDRPSMKEVLDMLRGNSKDLELPPKLEFYPTNPPLIPGERTDVRSIDDEFTDSLCESVSLEIEEL